MVNKARGGVKNKVGRPATQDWIWEFALIEAQARLSGQPYDRLLNGMQLRKLVAEDRNIVPRTVPSATIKRRYYQKRHSLLSRSAPRTIAIPSINHHEGAGLYL